MATEPIKMTEQERHEFDLWILKTEHQRWRESQLRIISYQCIHDAIGLASLGQLWSTRFTNIL